MLKVLFPWKQNNTKKVLSAMEQVVNEEPSEEEQPPENLPLLPCHVCNRTFLPQPLKKHIPICEQALRKKRKPFDSLKQRVEGTDMAPFYQKTYLKKATPEMSSQVQAGEVYGNNKVSKWREKHVELQNTIKNAKGSTNSVMTTHPSSTNSSTPNRKIGHLAVTQTSSNERCPVCDRSFGPKAFDRHVEFCREQKNRVQVHKSPAVVQQAKERLEARINYRVPPLRQSKRSLVRDKYCPSSQTNLLHRSNSIVQGKSTTSISATAGPNRRQTISNNERNNEKNNNKKETTGKSRIDKIGDCGDGKESTKNDNGNTKSSTTPTTPTHYDPFERAHLQLMELIEDDNRSVAVSPVSTLSPFSTITPTLEFRPFFTANSTPKSDNKRASVIDPPHGFQDSRASRDLDKEFEILESLMNNNLDETSEEPLREPSCEDVDAIDPSLINEQDNLSIPELASSDEHSPIYGIGDSLARERKEIDEQLARDRRDLDQRLTRNNREHETLRVKKINRIDGKSGREIRERAARETRKMYEHLAREVDEVRETDESLIREVEERFTREIDERLTREIEERLTREKSVTDSRLARKGNERPAKTKGSVIDERSSRETRQVDERLLAREVHELLAPEVDESLTREVEERLAREIEEHLNRDKSVTESRLARKGNDRPAKTKGGVFDERPSRETRKVEERLTRRPTRLSIKPTVRSLPLIRPDQVRLAPDGSSAESQAMEGRRGSPGAFVFKGKTRSKMRIDFSPETPKSKGSSRRLGTSSLQAGMEVEKSLDEEVHDGFPKEQTFVINRTPTAEELYPDNPVMYEEFKKYEEMYRREKEGRSSSSKKQKKPTDYGISIDDSIKSIGDSAYGSLNRKQQIMEQDNLDEVKEIVTTAMTPSERLPKFCHECGNKYPVASAKFCVECGVKRLVL